MINAIEKINKLSAYTLKNSERILNQLTTFQQLI